VNERILYLDDEPAILFLMTRMLEHLGYRVAGFTLAAEALAAFEADPSSFDLVITDLSMPGPSGLEVARQILQAHPRAAVVIASGSVDPQDEERARAVGVRAVISKPGSIEAMAEAIGRLLTQDDK